MVSIFRQWRNRLQCSNTKRNDLSIDNEVRNVYNTLEELTNENCILKTRIDKLEETFHRWINSEQVYLLKRIEKLENINRQLHENYQTYQIQNDSCLQTITDLLVKILFTQQELTKQCIERHNKNEGVQWRKKQQQQYDGSFIQNVRSPSYHLSSNQLDDGQYITNDQSMWHHDRLMIVEEHDQKTTNYASEFNKHSSTLATIKSKTDKKSTTSTNKLYFILNNEKIPLKSTRDNQRLTTIENSNTTNRKQQASATTINKNRRIPTPNKSTIATSSISKPPKVPTTTVRPPTSNIRQRPSPVNPRTTLSSSTTTTKPSRPRYTLAKPPEPLRPTRLRSGQATVVSQSARVTDLDALITKPPIKSTKVSSPSKINPVQKSLFPKSNIKIVRPVRSQELKLFSSHLKPDKPSQTKDSISTITPPSLETITDKTSNINRDFSADSLNEHYHIQLLLEQNVSISTQNHLSNENIQQTDDKNSNNDEGYFLKTVDNSNQSLPVITLPEIPSTKKPSIHRLVFPARLGRMVFSRRILSDSDIYQKNCSKDNEIHHNVYHLDTIRDYSMEFYMLTTYASDSQLRAWIDSNNDEVEKNVCQLNENRFIQYDDDDGDERINNQLKTIHSSDSLNRIEQELDWYSELEVLNLSNNQEEKQENTSSYSSEVQIGELLQSEQLSLPSVTMTTSIDSSTSASWETPNSTSNQLHPSPPHSSINDETNSILREILSHSWTEYSSSSDNIDQEGDVNHYEHEPISSIKTDEFQTDFYYLCPITNTISFSKTDYKPLYHDV